jgi:hypothetical protein
MASEIFFDNLLNMGRESEKQIVTVEILADVASMLRDALDAMDNAISIAKKNELLQLEVKHIPKGKSAIKDIHEFAAVLENCVQQAIFPRPVVYEKIKPTIVSTQLVAENKTRETPMGSKRQGKSGSL